MQLEYYIYLSIILFCVGVFGVLIRRNIIIVFMCIELMLNSVNLLLVVFSKYHYNASLMDMPNKVGTDAQVFVFFTMLVAAAEVSVGLAILTMVYRNTKSINVSYLFRLRH